MDVPLRVAADPEVLDDGVVGDEVEDEPETRLAKSLPQLRQAVLAAEAVRRLVAR